MKLATIILILTTVTAQALNPNGYYPDMMGDDGGMYDYENGLITDQETGRVCDGWLENDEEVMVGCVDGDE